MNSTYGWLYQKYAYPLLEKQREKAREEMKALCRECGLDPEQQLTFTDQMEYSSFRGSVFHRDLFWHTVCIQSILFETERNHGTLSNRPITHQRTGTPQRQRRKRKNQSA